MKTLSVGDIQDKLRPWALRKLDRENFDKIMDDELIDAINGVAQDLNEQAEIHSERYNNTTVKGETNYEMQGVILKVYYFRYEDADWKDQRWTFVEDVIVLKNEPGSDDINMDIHYLRQIEYVTNVKTDEVDLPSEVLLDFLDLLKVKLLVDWGDLPPEEYQQRLLYYAQKARQKLPTRAANNYGVFSHWLGRDDTKYDITDQWVSQDSVTVDASGNYYFV